MGKLNASTEIIPIQGPSESNRGHDYKFKTNLSPMKHFKTYPYFSDPNIVSRVEQYLEEHKNSVYVDIDDMVNELQKKYRDYTKRKRGPFKQMVGKAFAVVLQTCGIGKQVDVNSSEESEEDIDSDDGLASLEDSTVSSEQMMSLYMRQQQSRKMGRGGEEDKELINISSDEDDDKDNKIREPSKGKSAKTRPQPPSQTTIIPVSQISCFLKSKTSPPKISAQPTIPKPVGNPSRIITVTSAPTPKPATTIIPVSQKPKKRKAGNGEAGPPTRKRKREVLLQESKLNFRDIGGIPKVLEEVCKLLVHIRHPEVYHQIGVQPPRGFLLHGPPGCGKTLLAQAIAGELEVPLVKVAATELVAGVSGESEERIRDLFEQAASESPCVLFLDEVDAITPRRLTAQREMERRIVAQLLSCLDELSQKEGGDGVLVIGATNRPDALDPALRRAGRFDQEICLGIPDQQARLHILKVCCSKLRLSPNFCYEFVAQNTPGFVGADIMALTREAAMAAVNRTLGVLNRKKHEAEAIAQRKQVLPKKKATVEKSKPIEEVKEVTEKEVKELTEKEVKELPEKEVKSSEETPSEDKDKTKTEEEKKDSTSIVSLAEDTSSNDKEQEENTNAQEASPVKETESEDIKIEEEILDDASPMDVTDNSIIVLETQPVEMDVTKAISSEAPTLDDLLEWLHDQPPLTKEQLSALFVEMDDFKCALKTVQPSAKREGFATVPDVTWDDVGSLRDIREELQMAILAPIRHPKKFAALGLSTPMGVLLCGPPGCGKTLLAKAVANEAGVNFISVKGPELLNMYVGESEKAVRQCFQRAKNSAPCVIFFDELDALCPKRSDSGDGGVSTRVVNQMLTEMDGMECRKGVYLMAATNRPDIVDPAVLRPGRLDKILYVGLPGSSDRVDILTALTKNGTQPPLDADVSLEALGRCEICEGYTGADLAALVREAGIEALKEHMAQDEDTPLVVAEKHFKRAMLKIRPSVTEKDRVHYEKLRQIYTVVPSGTI